MLNVKIVYHNPSLLHIEKIDKGEWIDLRASKAYHLKPGEFALIDLGVSMKLPDGYEAHLAPRSSTFKNYGIVQTNSIGVIDNSFSGTNDIWMMPVYATRDTYIKVNDRICQFRIIKHQPDLDIKEVNMIEVNSLDDVNRGGFGSTGV